MENHDEILLFYFEKVKDILAPPGTWIQNISMEVGEITNRYCLLGAIFVSIGSWDTEESLFITMCDLFLEINEIPYTTPLARVSAMIAWNDNHERTYDDVMKALDLVIGYLDNKVHQKEKNNGLC